MPSPTGINRNLTHYADPGFSRYIRRAFLASAGYDEADLERPVVGIADTSSDYTTCHRAMPQLVESRQTRRARSGRPTPCLSDPFPRRNPPLPHRHALPQPHGHGDRGNDRRPAHGLGRAARRLRQNPASPTHGLGFRVRARHPPRRRADAGPETGAASDWAHARIAAATGHSTGPVRSTPKKSPLSSRACAQPPGPAWSWARPQPWPA